MLFAHITTVAPTTSGGWLALAMSAANSSDLVGFQSEPNCGRGTIGILWSCFTTIVLSMWASLHLDLFDTGLTVRIAMFIACLLLPEAGVAIAAKEWATAMHWRNEIRKQPGWAEWSLKQSFLVLMGGVICDQGINESEISATNSAAQEGQAGNRKTEKQDETTELEQQALPKAPSIRNSSDSDDEEKFEPNRLTLDVLMDLIKKGNEIDHVSEEAGQKSPQGKEAGSQQTNNPAAACKETGESHRVTFDMFPSKKDINKRAKTDAMVKVIAVGQALWFAANVIFRLVVGTSLSLLEIVTVAYVLCGIVLYAMWFAKPQGLEEAFTVSIPAAVIPRKEVSRTPKREDPWSKGQVARLGAGLAVVALFSAVHIAAWNYHFPSVAEAWLWRVSVIGSWALASLPVLNPILPESWYSSPGWYGSFKKPLRIVIATPYLALRLVTFVLMFMAFRAAPRSVYEDADWTSYWVSLGG